MNLIQVSNSGYSSPAFMVCNHGEMVRQKPRMVINYKAVNNATEDIAYRIPIKDELLTKLAHKNVFSKLDCKSGFFQIKMEPESIQYTAFSCCLGNFEWLVMPMGFKNAPSIFQQWMDSILGEYQDVWYTLMIFLSLAKRCRNMSTI